MNKPTLSFPCFRSAKGLGPAHGFGRFTCQGCQVTYSEGKVDSDGDFCSSDCRTCFYLESPASVFETQTARVMPIAPAVRNVSPGPVAARTSNE
jgi:hypothetical protein